MVGWFFSRSRSEFRPSCRETGLHSQLSLELGRGGPAQPFVYALVQASSVGGSLVREFHAKFHHFHDRYPVKSRSKSKRNLSNPVKTR